MRSRRRRQRASSVWSFTPLMADSYTEASQFKKGSRMLLQDARKLTGAVAGSKKRQQRRRRKLGRSKPLMADSQQASMGCMQVHAWGCFDLVKATEGMAGDERRRRRRSSKLGRTLTNPKLGHATATTTVHQTSSNFVERKNSARGTWSSTCFPTKSSERGGCPRRSPSRFPAMHLHRRQTGAFPATRSGWGNFLGSTDPTARGIGTNNQKEKKPHLHRSWRRW